MVIQFIVLVPHRNIAATAPMIFEDMLCLANIYALDLMKQPQLDHQLLAI